MLSVDGPWIYIVQQCAVNYMQTCKWRCFLGRLEDDCLENIINCKTGVKVFEGCCLTHACWIVNIVSSS